MSIVFALLAIVMVIAHPLTASLLLGGLAVVRILRPLGRIDLLRFLLHAHRYSIFRLLFMAVTIVAWLMGFALWAANIRAIESWLAGDLMSQLSLINYAHTRGGLTTLDLASIVVKMYGAVLILLPVSATLYFSGQISPSGDMHRIRVESLPVLGLVVVLFLLEAVALFGPLVIDLQRAFVYMAVPVTLLAPLPLASWLVPRRKMRPIKIASLSALVVLTVTASYPSPYLFQPNGQLTPAELAAAQWIGQDPSQISGIVTVWPFAPVVGMALALQGRRGPPPNESFFPDHLGYSARDTLGPTYPENTLVVVSRFDILTTTVLWRATGRFSALDYGRLDTDFTLGKVYSNGDVSIWSVEV